MEMEVEEEFNWTHDVFTNEVVMRHVFSLLDVPALKQCRLVNSCWYHMSSGIFFRGTCFNIQEVQADLLGFQPHVRRKQNNNNKREMEKEQGESLKCKGEIVNLIESFNFHHPHIRMGPSFMAQLTDEDIVKSVLQGTTHLDFKFWRINRYAFHNDPLPHVNRILTHVGSQLEELTLQGNLKQSQNKDLDLISIFPENIAFPELRALSLNISYLEIHETKIPAFLSRILSAVPNLKELSLRNIGFDLGRIMEATDFKGLDKQISKLLLEYTTVHDSQRVGLFLQNFVALTCLSVQDMEIHGSKEWGALIDILNHLSSSSSLSRTLKTMDFQVTFADPQFTPPFDIFPRFNKLKELSLTLQLCYLTDGVLEIIHWERVLDEINFGKSFPELRKLVLEIKQGSSDSLLDLSSSNIDERSREVSICPTLRTLIIKSGTEDARRHIRRDIRQKLFCKFPNAKIYFMGKYLDRTIHSNMVVRLLS